MSEAAQAELRRDLKPITKVFEEHSLPETYTAGDDDDVYAPLTGTVGTGRPRRRLADALGSRCA